MVYRVESLTIVNKASSGDLDKDPGAWAQQQVHGHRLCSWYLDIHSSWYMGIDSAASTCTYTAAGTWAYTAAGAWAYTAAGTWA